MLFMSDDPASARAVTTQPSPVPTVLVPAPLDCFLMRGGGKSAAWLLPRMVAKNMSAAPADAGAELEIGEAGAPAGRCGGVADEGLLMLSGVLMLSRCISFVGTMASNVDKTVALLMAARRFPPALHDLINDVWSPGAMGTARFEGATWHGAMVQVPNDRNEPRPDEAAWRGRGADSAEPEAEATARGRRREGA